MSEGNPYAGEVVLTLDGERHVLKLTLGALAELEAGLEADSLVALVERFETKAFSARDVIVLLLAGLRGGGWRGDVETLLSAEIEGGPLEVTRVAALLLGRAFALPGPLA
ncbi:gene transfer agent family protein [Jannaschia sp. M317]|uniref:gene transfer agent family protein n=1 Tax=Jannaschia sp. M317 TaxID=2867011 RepID=UPI0021A2660F|nr:gene transfer agent family protein [Jannaschia sp. M317]UWQ16986.1 gene transfer agent family protein [Jannaschia sp. M317]